MSATEMDAQRVLLVEDNDSMADVTVMFIESVGWTCRRASSVGEATRILSENACDVMVLDHSLPDGSGTELAQLFAHLPAVVLTGYDEIDLAAQTGGTLPPHIVVKTKPLDLDDLIAAIQEAVSRLSA